MASDLNGNQWYQPVSGLGSVGSYQISGIPFATGSLTVTTASTTVVNFPAVTRFIVVRNNNSGNLRVGFSENGINNSNYFILGHNEAFAAELRVSKLFLKADSANTTATVVSGLTGIPAGSLASNWSGSLGVG